MTETLLLTHGDVSRWLNGGVGLAFQDLVAAWLVYERALEAGSGTRVNWRI